MLGNQLFPIENMQTAATDFIFMAEDLGLCTYEKHHKLDFNVFSGDARKTG